MPLSDDLPALLGVQAVDQKIGRAQAALAALDTGATLAAAYNSAKAEAERLRATALKAQAEQRDAEMRLQSIETKTAQVQKTLFSGTVTSPKELENLQKEVEMLGRQRGDGETRVLEAMEAAGEQSSAADAAEAKVAAIAGKYRTVRAAYKERHAALTAEIAAHETDRTEAAAHVPGGLLQRYDTIRAKKNGIGAAPMGPDGTCGACHTRVSAYLADAVKAADTVQECESCGRILVSAPPAAGDVAR